MSRNVILPNGRVVAVSDQDAEDIERGQGTGATAPRTEMAGEAGERERLDVAARIRREAYGGVGGAIESATGGALDALTFGGGTRAVNALSPGALDSYRKSVAEHPVANVAGELGGALVPGVGEFAVAGRVGRAVGVGTRTARLAEGAVIGAGGTVAHANAVGDDLTAEALVEGAAVGGLFNYGVGALGDRLMGAGQRARKAVEANRAVGTAEELFSRESPAYNELRDARDAARKSAMEDFRDAKLVRNKYDAYLGDAQRMEKVGDGLSNAVNDLRAYRAEAFGADTLGISEAEKAVMGTIESAERQVTAGRTLLRGGDAAGADRVFRGAAEFLTSESPVPVAQRIPAMPELPVGTPAPPLDLRLPEDLSKFTSMSPAKVAELANHLADYSTATSSEVEALKKLAGELGVEAKDAPGELLADVHSALRRHASALDELEGPAGKSHLERLLKWTARRGAEVVGARKLGNWFGPVGTVAGWTIGGTVSDVVTSAVTESRAGLRNRVQELVAKYAPRAGRAARALAPVTAELSVSFPSGKKDRGELTELAARRANELRAAAVSGPDALYEAVRPLSDVNGDVALAVHRKALAAVQVAAASAPRDSGLLPLNGGSSWKPSPTEAVALAYRLEALRAPMRAIERSLSGDTHPAASDALRNSWPAMVGLVAEELSGREMGTRSGGASALLGAPNFGLDDPLATVSLQGMYMRNAGAPQSPAPGPEGRPPKAGRTTVAGSNVDALISQ